LKIAFLVNDIDSEIPEYTTTRLARAAVRSGHEAFYVGAGDLGYGGATNVTAAARAAASGSDGSLEAFLDDIRASDPIELGMEDLDVLMLRNDSVEDLHDRPWALSVGPLFGQMVAEAGVLVVNDPVGLTMASSKLYLEKFPKRIRPRCLVSRDQEEVTGFVEEIGGTAVVKPLFGAKGRNVFLARSEDENLHQLIEAVLIDGYVLAQEYVPEAEEGDIRLFLLDGEVLERDGEIAAFRRVPPEDDLRSNISTGGKSIAVTITDRELDIAAAMKDRLKDDGMFFVGIDIVGDKVVEINAESPGGLQSAEHFTGVDFGPSVIEALETRLA
jgi:glutathione synthase